VDRRERSASRGALRERCMRPPVRWRRCAGAADGRCGVAMSWVHPRPMRAHMYWLGRPHWRGRVEGAPATRTTTMFLNSNQEHARANFKFRILGRSAESSFACSPSDTLCVRRTALPLAFSTTEGMISRHQLENSAPAQVGSEAVSDPRTDQGLDDHRGRLAASCVGPLQSSGKSMYHLHPAKFPLHCSCHVSWRSS
jgi:hypothetical protein